MSGEWGGGEVVIVYSQFVYVCWYGCGVRGVCKGGVVFCGGYAKMYACMHTFMRACMRASVCVRVCMRAFMCKYAHVFVLVCTRVSMCLRHALVEDMTPLGPQKVLDGLWRFCLGLLHVDYV